MHTTSEYQDLIHAATNLRRLHHGRCIHERNSQVQSRDLDEGRNTNNTAERQIGDTINKTPVPSFLQYIAADEVLFRILDFLECSSLLNVSFTCSRLFYLATESAQNRTQAFARQRQLPSSFQLLRGMEQMELPQDYYLPQTASSSSSSQLPYVPIPTLLLRRSIVVSNCGDPEYNGVYHCTEASSNGFVFTKPRWFTLARSNGRQSHYSERGAEEWPAETSRLLRCIIAKKYSEQTLLWYMSKEELVPSDSGEMPSGGTIRQIFSFWAKILSTHHLNHHLATMDNDEANSRELWFGYPSQTSVLLRDDPGGGWGALDTNENVQPPTVEML